jgi:hypothetical protein
MNFFIPAFFLAFTLAASARLGETIDQCRARYGQETL